MYRFLLVITLAGVTGCGGTALGTSGVPGSVPRSAGASGFASLPPHAETSRIAIFQRELDAMRMHGVDGDFVIFTDTTDSPDGSCYVQLSGGTSGSPPTYGYTLEAGHSCRSADAGALTGLGYGLPGSGGGGDPNFFQTVQLAGGVTNHTMAVEVEASFLTGLHASDDYTVSVKRGGYPTP